MHCTELNWLAQTSRLFERLTRDRSLWSATYINSPCFLPPGPLESQSTNDLERVIFRGMRLSERCASSAQGDSEGNSILQPRKTGYIHQGESAVKYLHLICSRYLAVCFAESFVIYDLGDPSSYDSSSDSTIPITPGLPLFTYQCSAGEQFFMMTSNTEDPYLATMIRGPPVDVFRVFVHLPLHYE
jgi:hypothetical protein